MRKHLLIGSLVLLAAACELVVDVDIPLSAPQLTLNAFVTPDSLWQARLTLSRHILDEASFNHVTDALVIIYEDGVPIDTLHDTGLGALYQSTDGKPAPNKRYEIRASSTEHGTVRSESFVPERVPITSVDIHIPDRMSGDDMTATVKFQDRPGETNYYQISMEIENRYKNHQTGDSVVFRNKVYIYSDEPGIDGDNTDGGLEILLRDILFEGKEATVRFKSSVWAIGPNGRLFIHLRTLSEDFYRYQTTLNLQGRTSDDPFAQPVSVYNNVEQGFGIFAGYSGDVFVYQP